MLSSIMAGVFISTALYLWLKFIFASDAKKALREGKTIICGYGSETVTLTKEKVSSISLFTVIDTDGRRHKLCDYISKDLLQKL